MYHMHPHALADLGLCCVATAAFLGLATLVGLEKQTV